jgi:hypothetical protein
MGIALVLREDVERITGSYGVGSGVIYISLRLGGLDANRRRKA